MNKKLVHRFHLARSVAAILAAGTLLTACGGWGTPTNTIGGTLTSPANTGDGTVTGLTDTIGGGVNGFSGTLVLRNNGGDKLSVSANGSFTFATALANGSAYNVTVLIQPAGRICTVTNGVGTLSGANVTNVAVACVTSVVRFAYVANRNDNTVSIYTVDAVSGQLRARGYVLAGTNPVSVTVDPSGRFAYVANLGSNDVSAYSINAATGALSAVGAAVAAGTLPRSVTTTGTIQ